MTPAERTVVAACTSLLLAVLVPEAGRSASDKVLGYLSQNPEWTVEIHQRSDGTKYCLAITRTAKRGGENFQFSLLVAQPSEVELITDAPIPKSKEAAVEMPDGGGLDLYDLVLGRKGSKYTVGNEITSPMMRDLVDGLRNAPSAVFVVGGKGYFLPMKRFSLTYSDLVKCERYNAGLVLDE
jgi:hypothetical protein